MIIDLNVEFVGLTLGFDGGWAGFLGDKNLSLQGPKISLNHPETTSVLPQFPSLYKVNVRYIQMYRSIALILSKY